MYIFFELFKFDGIKNYQLGFQVPASPVMEGIINFHHDLFFFLTAILFFVFYLFIRCIMLFNKEKNPKPIVVVHAPLLEIVWTLIPAIILVFVAIPSFSLLYSMDEIIEPLITIKVIGHQWYWSYEFLDPNILFKLYFEEKNINNFNRFIENIYLLKNDKDIIESFIQKKEFIKMYSFEPLKVTASFDSYMLQNDQLSKNNPNRLLEVDNRLYLPVETNIRVLVTSGDVLHSWAIPALGIKLDACPGRLNQTSMYIKRPGIFYGQCSEICGINHGFMPIAIVGIDILGNGAKISANVAESILPIYSILLGKHYNNLN